MAGLEPGGTKPDRTALLSAFVIFLGLTLVLLALSFPAGVYSVFSGGLSRNFTFASIVKPYLWIGPAAVRVPIQVSAGALFALLTAIYAAFLVYSLWERERPLRAISDAFREGVGALFSSPFLVAIISIGFLIFTASIIDQIVASTGTPIGELTGDPLSLLVGLTYSPLVEEIGFRVVLIGVVAFILSISRPWKKALAALWKPSTAIEGLTLGSGASVIIWAATCFSAATFGVSHVVSGWDIGKFPDAAFGGLVLGYLYVRYGFHVAVIAHWGVDFFDTVFAFFGQAAYGIPANSGTQVYALQAVLVLNFLLLFGLMSFLLVIYLGARKLARLRSGAPSGDFKGLQGGGGVEP